MVIPLALPRYRSSVQLEEMRGWVVTGLNKLGEEGSSLLNDVEYENFPILIITSALFPINLSRRDSSVLQCDGILPVPGQVNRQH